MKQMHLLCILLLFSSVAVAVAIETETGGDVDGADFISLGAILDLTSRVGKEETVAMKMAVDDCFKYPTLLHIKDSVHVIAAAMELITQDKVGVILGLRAWDEVALISRHADGAHVPILSFADTIPVWASKRWSYLLEAKHSQYREMDAVAAIVGTWRWNKVNFIYEDVNSATFSIVPRLIDALAQVGSSIEYMLPLPPLAFLSSELEKLKSKQCRVFIVHTSLPLAKTLFWEANKLGLMDKDSVWITTTSITDHFDFVNTSVISSMQGVLGVKTHYAQSAGDFHLRFRNRFLSEYPEEVNLEPGIFALQAYDAIRAVAVATAATSVNQTRNASAIHGQELLEKMLLSNFKGLTGEFRYIEGALAPLNTFGIVNVVGTSYRRLGFWSQGLGFSRKRDNHRAYKASMTTLGQVLWPGTPVSAPRGWALPTYANPLMIGVPESPTFNQFVIVKYEFAGDKPTVSGYSIDVFNAVLESLPYYLPHDFIPYNGSYDSLVRQIYHKKFDALVGDISIVADRCDFAEFSQPWTDSGLQMVVFKNSRANRAWLFFKPFTVAMWGLTAGVNIYNGFVVWLMERSHHPEFNGSAWNKVGALIWLAFTTLFSLHGDRLHSNLSRMTMVVWLFVAIIIIQSYTASLTSMLTITRLESNKITVEYLKQSNAKVGCDGGSFVVNYLTNVLGLDAKNIRPFTIYTDYPQALERGEIAAAFLEVPYINVFLAQHCRDFAVVGPTYKIGGFGFVFPKGSLILPDISKAILQVSEKGKLLELENALLYSYNCTESKSDEDRLGLSSFWGLFVITGGTTTTALVLYLFRCFMNPNGLAAIHMHATPIGEHHPDVDELGMFASELKSFMNPNGLAAIHMHATPIGEHHPDVDELGMFASELRSSKGHHIRSLEITMERGG